MIYIPRLCDILSLESIVSSLKDKTINTTQPISLQKADLPLVYIESQKCLSYKELKEKDSKRIPLRINSPKQLYPRKSNNPHEIPYYQT